MLQRGIFAILRYFCSAKTWRLCAPCLRGLHHRGNSAGHSLRGDGWKWWDGSSPSVISTYVLSPVLQNHRPRLSFPGKPRHVDFYAMDYNSPRSYRQNFFRDILSGCRSWCMHLRKSPLPESEVGLCGNHIWLIVTCLFSQMFKGLMPSMASTPFYRF